jgi:hypothetical protein
MARPKTGYKNAAGKRVCGTTTIIGRFKESGGLIHWAWDLGMQGINYRDVRDKAADSGTLAHDMIEAHLRGEEFTPDGAVDETTFVNARKGFDAFMEWSEQTKLEVVDTEMVLVSEEYQYGGTPDAIGYCAGKLALLDWKTSNRIYQDYLIQIAAYRQLWHENHPEDQLETFHLLRFGKEYGEFSHHSFPVALVDKAWHAFVLMREMYDLDKDLKRAIG